MKTGARLAFLAIAVAALVGCQNDVSFKSIANHPAPEMQSTSARSVDAKRNYAYYRNTTYRGFWDDLARSFYYDNPNRLSPYPIISTSGNPR